MINLNKFEPTVGSKIKSDGFSEILRENTEYFAQQGINMVSGFSDLLTEEVLFDEYKTKMTQGLGADEAEQVEQLFENGRLGMLHESTISGMNPIAGLTMPTIRKMWVRTALKNAVPTETAKVPAFSISYMLPYIKDQKGVKHYLPETMRHENNLAELERVTIKSGAGVTEHESVQYIQLPADQFDVFSNAGGSVSAQDSLDPIFHIETVLVEDTSQKIVVPVNLKLDLRGQIQGMVHYALADGTQKTDTIFGTVDLEKGLITATSLKGMIKGFTIKAFYSSENNTRGESVGFDIKRKEVNIGTASHLHAEMPIEWIQDNLALFNIDGTVEVVDLMSKVTANKLDQKIKAYFDKSFEVSGSPFIGEFDVKPAAGFAGTPTEWRSELKSVLDYWATKLKTVTNFGQGYFVVMGNRMDINLIPEINWTFKAMQGEKSGTVVDYDLGATTFNNAFKIVASDNIPQGELIMFFCPVEKDQMTYKYYPYTYNIEKNGYNSPNAPLVPSIMMTKRDTIDELVPCQARIKILHNDGSLISSYAL